ncbi:MAG: M28 family peptidase [Acidobacteria bacterium]|nr:M28 family peptidase [Acidobacteriota bacterium]
MLSRWLFLFSFVAIAAAAPAGQPDSFPPEVQRVMKNFSKAALRAHMAFLADDLLEGRGTGSRGQEIAARYLAAQFEALGLEPGGDDSANDRQAHGMAARSYFQWVPMREVTIDKQQTEVVIEQNGRRHALQWAADFVAGGNVFSEQSEVAAPVVFAGYGVVDRARNYDDYAGLDVKGKIVALLPGAPSNFPSAERADRASGIEKGRSAARNGAVGIISLRTPVSEQMLPWSRSAIGAELPALRWLNRDDQPMDSFPELKAGATLSQPSAEELFAGAPKSFAQVLDDAAHSSVKGFPLAATAHIRVVSRHRRISSPNVIAILRGSDSQRQNEYIVYSAHTDHLGIGRPINGDSIYNGAVDDGSGCTALIEMARAFVSLPARPKRSIIFAAFTGEEKGLLGAGYFAHNPPVPIPNIVTGLNMDGASVFYVMKDIVALGVEHTTMEPLLERAAAAVGLKVSPDPMPEQVDFIRNDQYPLVKRGVPALSLEDGLEAADPQINGRKFAEDWIATRYHSPQDDMSQPLNFDAMVQYMKVNFLFGFSLAQQPQRPAWKPHDFFGDLYGSASPAKP